MKLSVLSVFFLVGLLFSCSPTPTSSQASTQTYSPANKALYDTILLQDSLLFVAFNSKDMIRFEPFFDKGLEVYQDDKGVRNYEQSMQAFKSIFESGSNLKRNLIRESIEVYPIKDFGAIQTGRHTFCHTENGKEECFTFKFLLIWKKDNSRWRITRMITYDH